MEKYKRTYKNRQTRQVWMKEKSVKEKGQKKKPENIGTIILAFIITIHAIINASGILFAISYRVPLSIPECQRRKVFEMHRHLLPFKMPVPSIRMKWSISLIGKVSQVTAKGQWMGMSELVNVLYTKINQDSSTTNSLFTIFWDDSQFSTIT